MRNRQLYLSILSAGLMIGGMGMPSARADDSSTKPEKPAARGEGRQGFPMLDRYKAAVEELKLSDEQKGKVEGYFADAKSQMTKIREDSAGDRQEAMKKSREVVDKLRENVASVLTDDQKEQLKAKMKSVFQGGAEGGGRLKATLDKLNLSDDQKTKIKDIMEDLATKAKAIREGGGEGAREKMGELMKDTREKIMNVLTDDQKEKFKELSQEAGGPNGGPRNKDKKPDSK
jgi:Spy/CpxP family protein refolding chaperone